ncbi:MULTISPECIES: hypothetical protein [Bacillaceae]|uniref:Uncharacterized protein n=1 Tax=Evansella alkalicola TaxID=745819 RepID=A0ABS6JTN9_9BACI|nr:MULTISPECIES: hypothetical protein [Bacillaceae]MBU9721612.1 hypothetical protein [Bacillus alkalicola]
MQLPLNQNQIDGIWKTLTLEQQQWINNYTNQRRRDKWFEALAKRKGIIINAQTTDEEKREAIDDWELVEVLDGGKGNTPYRCECGRQIRFQYIVSHASKTISYKLGSTCIEHYTGLSADVVKDVEKGIFQINTKRDEILLKINGNQLTNLSRYIDKGIEIQENILQQVELGIPLMDGQIDALETQLEDIEWQLSFEKRKKERTEWQRKWRENKASNKNQRHLSRVDKIPQETLIEIKERNKYTYDSFIEENKASLVKIREKEAMLSPKLSEEWVWMQNEVRRLKKEGNMDFHKFFLRMDNMMIALKIKK